VAKVLHHLGPAPSQAKPKAPPQSFKTSVPLPSHTPKKRRSLAAWLPRLLCRLRPPLDLSLPGTALVTARPKRVRRASEPSFCRNAALQAKRGGASVTLTRQLQHTETVPQGRPSPIGMRRGCGTGTAPAYCKASKVGAALLPPGTARRGCGAGRVPDENAEQSRA